MGVSKCGDLFAISPPAAGDIAPSSCAQRILNHLYVSTPFKIEIIFFSIFICIFRFIFVSFF